MRSSKSRSRNKSNRQRTIGNIINRVFDSSGPEGKVRGTPSQIIEKYLQLARDAQLSNDRVAEQNFLQHAEHYTRMLGEAQREQAREQEERSRQYQQGGNSNSGANGGNGNSGGNGGNGNSGGNGNREPREPREARDYAAAGAEQPRFDEPRYEGAPVMMPPLFGAEDEGPGLVETPEMRPQAPRLDTPRSDAPRSDTPRSGEAKGGEMAEKPAKSSASRSRKPKPKVPAADASAEAPAEAPAETASEPSQAE